MNCSRAKEVLPLYAGGDLSPAEADRTSAHLQQCADCREIHDDLASNQGLLRSLRRETVAPAALTAMRQDLFPLLERTRLGWWIRLERFFLVEVRRPRFAIAGAALALIVSASLFAQLRHVAANPDKAAAVFEGSDMLRLPEDYRDWVLVGRATEPPHSGVAGEKIARNVYMSPSAYREYRRNGSFPEGTVMVLESRAAKDNDGVTLEASVKHRKFSDGWGYFRFDSTAGQLAKKAQALSESAGCLACHRDRGATDHVFTQFYSALKSALGVQI